MALNLVEAGFSQEPPAATPAPTPTPVPQPATSASSSDLAPAYLNPSPNPLVLPTQPQQVGIQAIQPITLQQAQELALRNNLQLQIAVKNLERSRAALRQAKAALFPTLSAQAGFQRQETFVLSAPPQSTSSSSGLDSLFSQLGLNSSSNSSSGSSGSSGGSRSSLSDVLSATVTLSYDIYTSGQRSANIRAAVGQVRSQELLVETQLEQLRLDVSDAYYSVQDADEQVRINRAAVINSQQSLQDTQALERAGLGTRFDVLQAQVQLSNSVQNLTTSLNQQRITRWKMVQILNLSQTVDISAADPVAIAGTWELSLEDSIVLAFKNRAELEQQLVQRDINEQQRRAALAVLGPQLSLSAQYGVNNNFSPNPNLADNNYATNYYQVGTFVQWQAFDGGAARAQAAQYEKGIEIAEANFAVTRDEIRFNVQSAYSTLRSNFENIQTATLAVQQAQEALRLARLRFQAGVGTQTDVINSETALTTAQGNQVRAVIGYNRSLAQLQRYISNLPLKNNVAVATPASPVLKPTQTP
ncbi:TolC family protein [Neosynechococcus sphagnicola]|uniref:TolC family protein n=1 Tax=Neosynechococcus sphagnicola TaxID=1501145 RepID=UPI000A92E15F|nr:TolC family protein [Neosynechococcus sphagnicola]